MIVFCPQCFAELTSDAAECFACGRDLSIRKPVEELSVNQSAFRFAGRDATAEPVRGLLLQNRFVLFEWIEATENADIWIVLDQQQSTSGRGFFWHSNAAEQFQYHQQLVGISPVIFISEDPALSIIFGYSARPLRAFLEQQSVSLDLVWDLFARMLALFEGLKSRPQLPKMTLARLLIMEDDVVVNPWSDAAWCSRSESSRQLVRNLFWMLTQTAGDQWDELPPKLQRWAKLLWMGSEKAQSVESFEQACQHGYFSPLWDGARTRKRFAAGLLLIDSQLVRVPNLDRLIRWRALRPSRHLYDGRVLLESSVFALYESGFTEHSEAIPIHRFLRKVVASEASPTSGIALIVQAYTAVVYHHTPHFPVLAQCIRSATTITDWLDIAHVLQLHTDDHEGAVRALKRAKELASSTRDWLDIAHRLQLLNHPGSARAIALAEKSAATVQDRIALAEAEFAILGDGAAALNRVAGLIDHQTGLAEQCALLTQCIQTFGVLGPLVEWAEQLTALPHDDDGKALLLKFWERFATPERYVQIKAQLDAV